MHGRGNRGVARLRLGIAVRILALAIFATSMQAATTDPGGYTIFTVASDQGTAGTYTFTNLNMFRPVKFTVQIAPASVSTIGGVTVLTIPGAAFSANQWVGVGNQHFLEIATGTNAGLIVNIT